MFRQKKLLSHLFNLGIGLSLLFSQSTYAATPVNSNTIDPILKQNTSTEKTTSANFTITTKNSSIIAPLNTTNNLLINGNAGNDITGWINPDDVWIATNHWGDTFMPSEPTPFFVPKLNKGLEDLIKETTLYQDVSLANYPAGKEMYLSARMRNYPEELTDKCHLIVIYLDSNKKELSSEEVIYSNSEWGTKDLTTTIPNNAVTARITLFAQWQHGKVNNCYFDDVFFGPKYDLIFNVEPEKNKISLSEYVTTALTINNIEDITAEDIRIKYDTSKLKFVNYKQVDGITLVHADENNGELRFILASNGEKNIIKGKTTLLNLNFQGIAQGEALIDVTKGRVTDGINMEEDVAADSCGQATLLIEGAPDDVNHSGEFTLLDLGIDARHLGKDPASNELLQYNTDIVINNAIDEADLMQIGKYMLANANYAFNS